MDDMSGNEVQVLAGTAEGGLRWLVVAQGDSDDLYTFLRVYSGEVPRKYSGVSRRSKDEASAEEQVYTTNEGDVLLSISGSSVFVSEGFPVALARKLRDRIASVQSDAPLQIAAGAAGGRIKAGSNDPGLNVVRTLSAAGLAKAALASVGH